jgi:hypothetical protein
MCCPCVPSSSTGTYQFYPSSRALACSVAELLDPALCHAVYVFLRLYRSRLSLA